MANDEGEEGAGGGSCHWNRYKCALILAMLSLLTLSVTRQDA